ncbi:MAG: S-layer protein [Candidatus Aenigmarchaeota archaeon]|nr:S-layer protein [Candidatus Aenigmarchaeota archaeon]
MKDKIIALLLTAIMAVMTSVPVLGAITLGDYPAPFCKGGVCNFYVVYGSNAKADDLVGGSDVTARLASENYVETAVAAGEEVTLIGEGARIDTASNRILLGEKINNARTGITSTDLPTLLKKGEVLDDQGNSYPYVQDIYLDDAAELTFSTSGGDLRDPVIHIALPSSAVTTANYIYKTRVTFSKTINVSSTAVVDNVITLFGSEWTIGTGSDYNKLILYGGANVVTLKELEEQKVTVGGVEYTVKVEGVSGTTTGVISVNGKTQSVTKGSTYKISGLDVYISDVYYYPKEAQVSSMKLSLGSQKLTLEDGSEVLFGTENWVENTLVDITGTPGQGISKIEVYVAAQDSDYDDVQIGKSYTDPVWKTFRLEFSSTTPALDDPNNDEIVVVYSGDRTMTVKFKDYFKNEKTIEFAYNNVSAITSTPTIYLMDSNQYHIHIKEGDAIYKDHYVVVNQGDETHLLQLDDVPYGTLRSTDKVRLKDVFTGTVYEKTTGTNLNDTITIGSQTYYLNIYNGTTKAESYVKLTWDDTNAYSADSGATYGVAGKITAFPGLKAKNGEYIYLVNNYTTFSCGDDVIVPQTGTTAGLIHIDCTATPTTVLKGKFNYTVTNVSATAYIQMTPVKDYRAAIAILEEKQADGTTQDVVYIPVTYTGTTSLKIAVTTPVFTTATLGNFVTLGTNTYIQKAYDAYGTLTTYDSYEQGKVTVTYPDNQIYANIFFLTEAAKVTTTAVAAEKIKKVVPISYSVAKLDTEIADPATVNKNLVLIGGSCANSLVQKLVDDGKLDTKYGCPGGVPAEGWEKGKGYIFLIENAFATGYSVIVIAGTDAIDTRNACSVMQQFDTPEIAAKLAGQTSVAVTAVSGAGITAL